MESTDLFQQFDTIETRIAELLSRCSRLETNNKELVSKIERLEEELGEKTEAEQRHAEEREFVKARIDNLLARLDEISIEDPPPDR